MSNTEKKLDALIDALGFDVELSMTKKGRPYGSLASSPAGVEVYKLDDGLYYECDSNYKLTKRIDEERFTFTRYMIKDLIEVLGCHTVASNGHNNDDILTTISNLEAMINNEEI